MTTKSIIPGIKDVIIMSNLTSINWVIISFQKRKSKSRITKVITSKEIIVINK